MCGYLHYYGLVVLIIAKADGFVFGKNFGMFEFTFH